MTTHVIKPYAVPDALARRRCYAAREVSLKQRDGSTKPKVLRCGNATRAGCYTCLAHYKLEESIALVAAGGRPEGIEIHQHQDSL